MNILSGDHIVREVNDLSANIENNNWREKPLSKEINGIIHNVLLSSFMNECLDGSVKKSLKELKNKLSANPDEQLKVALRKDKELKSAVEVLKLLSSKKSLYEIARELPRNGRLNESLEILREIQKSHPEKNVLAPWIDYNWIRLSQLKLSNEEMEEILPQLTYLDFDLNVTKEETDRLFSLCSKLKTLKYESEQLDSLSNLPSSLEKLNVRSSNLKEIVNLPDGLKGLDCDDCENLVKFPAVLPDDLEIFNCANCENLVVLPALNAKLKTFDCSNSKVDLPHKLNEGLEIFKCSKTTIQLFPVLPEGLVNLESNDCPKLVNIRSLPTGLKTLDLRNCENLESVVVPGNLEKIYVKNCKSTLKLDGLGQSTKVIR